MPNISFSLTTPQFQNQTKFVTRRNGWQNLKPGTLLWGVEKAMGLKGETVVRLGQIVATEVSREPLNRMVRLQHYGAAEVLAEGFPDMTPADFVAFYAKHNRVRPNDFITRIRFEYVRPIRWRGNEMWRTPEEKPTHYRPALIVYAAPDRPFMVRGWYDAANDEWRAETKGALWGGSVLRWRYAPSMPAL